MTLTMTRPTTRPMPQPTGSLPPATGGAATTRPCAPRPAGSSSRGRAAEQRPQLARYRRRRAAVTLLVAGIVGGAATLADSVLAGPGGVPASAAGAGTASAGRTVRAEPGDSLWSIADERRGDVPITRYLEELIDLNGGTRIEAGQLVRLP